MLHIEITYYNFYLQLQQDNYKNWNYKKTRQSEKWTLNTSKSEEESEQQKWHLCVATTNLVCMHVFGFVKLCAYINVKRTML